MKTKTSLILIIAVSITIHFSSCEKLYIEPDIRNKTWITVDEPYCELIIATDAVMYCGSNIAKSNDSWYNGISVNIKANNGQVKWMLDLFPWGLEHDWNYILDYEFDGEYLRVIRDGTDTKVPVIGYGRKIQIK